MITSGGGTTSGTKHVVSSMKSATFAPHSTMTKKLKTIIILIYSGDGGMNNITIDVIIKKNFMTSSYGF